jgi:hypothetical protein
MRCLTSAVTVIAACFTFGLVLSADSGSPDFSGVWEVDAGKSHLQDGRAVTLTIEKVENKIKWVRSARDKDGKEVTSEFVCEAGSGECELNETGHKAKVTLWYNGPALVVLKTDGVKEDASTEWTLKMSDDKKTLTVGLEHIEPSGNTETLVFSKKALQ